MFCCAIWNSILYFVFMLLFVCLLSQVMTWSQRMPTVCATLTWSANWPVRKRRRVSSRRTGNSVVLAFVCWAHICAYTYIILWFHCNLRMMGPALLVTKFHNSYMASFFYCSLLSHKSPVSDTPVTTRLWPLTMWWFPSATTLNTPPSSRSVSLTTILTEMTI